MTADHEREAKALRAPPAWLAAVLRASGHEREAKALRAPEAAKSGPGGKDRKAPRRRVY